MNRLTVVGLGPGGSDLILPAARRAIDGASRRFVRTSRHPAVDELRREGVVFESFDHVYEREADLESVYRNIVDALCVAAPGLVYAVPGSPVVAERTVVLLRERLGDDLTVIPGVSFADLAWARLGVDPLAGARVIDARNFVVDAADVNGRMLVAQVDSGLVVSDVKLALLDVLDADHEIVVLQRLGLNDERVLRVPLAELDHGAFAPDHLTSVFVDTGSRSVGGELARLWQITQQLRAPGGCPWDQKQTHHSLARHLLEESYEVVEAINRLPVDAPNADDILEGAYEALADELGDLLFQAMIHSALAAEAGAFTIADVAQGIHDKLVRRHPHVFGDVSLETADDVVRSWEQIKRTEKRIDGGDDPESLVAGIATTLPGLLLLPKLFRKAVSVGLDPGADALERLRDALAHDDIGEIIAAAAALAWARDVDPEAAAKSAATRFRDQFVRMEQLAAARGVDLAADPKVAADLWAAAAG
jgi:tetrapyrrole methylase family protein / MazG family protein